MHLNIPMYLKGDFVKGTAEKPTQATIAALDEMAEDQLPANWEGLPYQVTLKIEGDEWTWTPNTTAMRCLIGTFGRESDNWKGKQIFLWTVEQNVRGQTKRVIYAKPAPQ